MKRSHAFTLIELLVVISIIALLVSLIMPSLSQARENATKSLCQSRIHGMTIGAFAYAQDNKQSLPYRNSWGGGIETTVGFSPTPYYDGVGLLFENDYVTDYRAFYCPGVDHMLTYVGGYWDQPTDYKPTWTKPLWFSGYIFITYQYRATSSYGYRPFKLSDPLATNQSFYSDFWLYNLASKCHKVGYNAARIDGSVRTVGNENGLMSYLALVPWYAHNTDWTFQETNWKNFFD